MSVEVQSGDIDELGHASNLVYLRWFLEAAVAHSEAVGLPVDAYRAQGGVFVVRRHVIDYLRPALRGDMLELRTWISSASAAACVREGELRDPPSGALLARVTTTWTFVDVRTGRPKRIPESVRVAFGEPPRRVLRLGTRSRDEDPVVVAGDRPHAPHDDVLATPDRQAQGGVTPDATPRR